MTNTQNNNGYPSQTSTAETQRLAPDAFESAFSITPQVGTFGYEAGNQAYNSRILEGITANFNLASLFNPAPGWNIGLVSGVLYSHVGSPDANFFGANSGSQLTEGANMYLVPILAQIGYKPTDSSMIALDLGAQLVDRSMGTSMSLGRPGDATTASAVDFFPSAGLDLGWEVARQVALNLRGDAIPMPSAVGFDATIGLTIGLV